MNDLIPQPHGGALRPRKSGSPTSWKATSKEVVDALRSLVPGAVANMQALIDNEDPRVSMVAIDKLMLWVYGPAPPGGFDVTGGLGPIDLTGLTADERAELGTAYSTVQRLLAAAAERVA